ncbi:outer membrane beta-barrel family protein [Mucilaginibacter sp.]|uniref:outer membrane beta-barrel family protein n=1 Tax=Mucilaginibacter sp. TaxID=1882438 RepID=UPI0025ECA839|nr:outer membrane beta-barrel family protein [Mucilaginibacter sp.]
MKKLFFLISACTLLQLEAAAQSSIVQGSIQNSKKERLSGTSILLYRFLDSTKISQQASDSSGDFKFTQISPGVYYIQVTMVGYLPVITTPFKISGTAVQLPALTMNEKITHLSEVVVNSRVPRLEQKSDRLVINVGNMNTAGDNSLEVLTKAPGIRLDKDDNILFRNNGGVNVMINGKQTFMTGSEVSNYLKLLPGNLISKIELIANPPGNFDAEGTAGVINIVLKRNKVAGYNGNVNSTAGYGRYGKLSGGLNLNYNSGKFSVYTRLSEAYIDSYNRLTINRQIGDENFNEVNFWHPKIYATSYILGADYFAAKNQTIGFMFKGLNSPQTVNAVSNSVITNSSGVIGYVNGSNPQKSGNDSYSFNFNYTINLDTIAQKLGFDADYVSNSATNNQSYLNEYLNGNGNPATAPVNLRSSNPVDFTVYSIKMDYSYLFAKKWTLEVGLKSSWVNTRSNIGFDSLKSAGYITDTVRSNDFRYTENLNAAYINLGTNLGKKWDLKASIRAEQTVSKANSITHRQVIDRNYWQLFPSLFLTFRPNDNSQFNASFSRRITRPNYSTLNSAIRYTDPYTAFQGNPYLQPSISGSFIFNYTYHNFQILSLSYLKINDAVNSVLFQNDQTRESINRYENLGSTNTFSATSSGNFNVTKWWNMNAEIDVLYNNVKTVVAGIPYRSSKYSWTANTQEEITLPKSYRLQISALYFSPSINGLAHTLAGTQIDAGIVKSLFSGKSTISFKVRDIFFGNRYRSILQYNNINTRWQNEWESRRYSLSFSYSFGNSKIKVARNRRTGTQQEEGRMQQQ